MARQQTLMLHATNEDFSHGWGTFVGRVGFEPHGVEAREVTLRELGDPNLASPWQLFKAACAFAEKAGFVAGYPTFEVSGRDFSAKHRVLLFSKDVAERVEIAGKDLPDPTAPSATHYHGIFHNYAREKGYLTGYPLTPMGEARDAAQTYHGVFLRKEAALHTRVLLNQLEGERPAHDDLFGFIRACQGLARKRGFLGCIPTGWFGEPEAKAIHDFQHGHHRHMLEHEGWTLKESHPLPPTKDDAGVIHYAVYLVLEK